MGMSTGGSGIASTPNVTPMIDVMLVLLIIFMLVIPQVNAGFVATPPEGQNLKPHPEDDTDQVLGVDQFGNYYVNKDMVRPEDLEQVIAGIYANREDAVMYVKAHKDLTYDKVLGALDLVAKGGVRVAALITEQRQGTESLVAGDRVLGGAGGGN